MLNFSRWRVSWKKETGVCKSKIYDYIQKGTLIAVSYDEAGNKTDSCTLVSAGDNTKLTLRPDKTEMKADNEDMVFVDVSLTDNMGIVKNLEDQNVTVQVTGAAKLAGIGSANPITEESYLGDTVSTWNGRMGIWIRSNGHKGIKLIYK